VIVTNYRSPDALFACLGSVEDALVDTERQVFVCDSEAESRTGALVAESFPSVEYRPFTDNVGYARLVNAGLRESRGDVVLVLNGDTLISREAVETLHEHLRADASTGMVGPRLLYADGSHQPSAFRFYRPSTILARRSSFGRTERGRRELDRFLLRDLVVPPLEQLGPVPVDWLMGSALLVRKDAVDEVGGMDERFWMYFEDVDWCRRFWKAGWSVVWVPAAAITHVHGQASRGGGGLRDLFASRYTRTHLASAAKYFAKHGVSGRR
jgi:GT2 family glycosyltransferase